MRSTAFLRSLFIRAILVVVLCYGCTQMAVRMTPAEVTYRAKCSSCHRILEPKEYGELQWSQYVEKYGQEMTPQEKEMVLQYWRTQR